MAIATHAEAVKLIPQNPRSDFFVRHEESPSAREFARKRGQVVKALKTHRAVAVTGHGKTVSPASKPGASRRQRLHAKELLKTLSELPTTEAERDQILKKLAGAAVF